MVICRVVTVDKYLSHTCDSDSLYPSLCVTIIHSHVTASFPVYFNRQVDFLSYLFTSVHGTGTGSRCKGSNVSPMEWNPAVVDEDSMRP